MRHQEVQSTKKTSLGSLDPIEKAVVAKFTKQIGNIEEVLSMHDAPDAPVWAANCSYGTEIILAWNRAKRAVMYEIRSEDADWGEEGYVWQGTSTMITLPARTRSETFYIKSINAAGMYSKQASSITLENEAPSAPVFTLVSSPSGFTVLLSDMESDVVKVVLSITEVDEQQKPLGETVQRVCEEKTYFFAAEPRTSWKVSAVAYDIIGAGEESAAKYVTVSGIDAWHIIDIPEHIVSPSHLTESLMEEIESAVDGVDYLDRQMSEAQQRLSQAESEMSEARQRLSQAESKLDSIDEQMLEAQQRLSQAESELDSVDEQMSEALRRLSQAESELDSVDEQMSEALQRLSQAESELDSVDGRVTDTEIKITELEGEIATKVSQTDYNTLAGRVETAETNITQNAQAIATKASQSSVDTLEGRVSAAETTITQHAQEIASKASQSSVDTLEGRVSTAETMITQQAQEIASKASQSSVDTLAGRVETAETNITQNAQAIATKASQSSVDTLEGRVSAAETTITQHAQEIASKASQSSVDTLEGRVSTAETMITQQAQEIASKASQSSVDTLAGRVETAETNIIQNAQAIATKASQSSVDALEGRVSTAEGELTVLADEVAAKVSQSVFDALEQRVTTNEGTLAVHADMIAARVTSEVFDLLEERVETAEGQLTVLADEVSAKVSQTVFDTLVGRVETAEGILEVLPGQINAKADQSVVDTLTGRVEEAEGQLSVLATEIAARVTQEVFDTLEGRVETAEGKLSVLADEISTKVSQTVFDELEGLVSRQGTQIALNTESITGIVTRVDNVEGQVTEHASQIQLLGDEITLKVQVRQDGKLVIAGIGMAVDEDGQSEVAMLADRFRVLTSVNGEMKSVFAVDTETGKVYVLGDLIATGLIRATEVQAEVAKHLLLAAEVATVDHLGALKIEAGAITVGGSAPGIPLTKPEGGKLWHFDGSLVSTDGTAPESGAAVATLRPDGRFGGAVAVEEGTTNCVPGNIQAWSDYASQASTYSIVPVSTPYGPGVQLAGQSAGRVGKHTSGNVNLGTSYATASIYFKPNVASGILTFYWDARDDAGVWRYATFFDKAINLSAYAPGQWYRLVCTASIAPNTFAGGTGFYVWAEGTFDVEIAAPQLETKPFATSFVDGTRAAGRLRYPQPLDKKRGTLSVWINPHVVVNWNNFFLMNLSTGRFLLYFGANGWSVWDFGPFDSGPRAPAGTIVAGQWTMHTLTWDVDAGVYRYYVNGEFVGERQYVEPDSLPSVLPTVTNYGALLDELLILPYAATPEQIQAWYAMGAPFHDPQERIGDERIPSASRWDAGIAEALSELADLSSEVSAKVTIFYQPNQPTAKAIGDIWYDTDADPVAIHRWNGSQWIDITTTALSAALAAAGDAQATADGKIKTYYQASAPTTGMSVGDLWVDTDDGNRLYRYSGTQWVDVADKTPIDASERPISAEGAGGRLNIDENGETWVRKSDGKVMFRFDANTGDAEYAGKLGAKVIEADNYKQVPVVDTYNVMDSFDSSHPLEIPIYIDEGMTIHDVRITARGMRYRAYASGASAGGSHSHDVEIEDHIHIIPFSIVDGESQAASISVNLSDHASHSHTYDMATKASNTLANLTWKSSTHAHTFSDSDTVSISISGSTDRVGGTGWYHSHSFSGSGSDSVSISGTTGSSSESYVYGLSQGLHEHDISTTSTNTGSGGPTSHFVIMNPPNGTHTHAVPLTLLLTTTESGGAQIRTSTSVDSHTHNLIYGIFDDTSANGLPRGVDLYFSNSENRSSYVKVADLSEPGSGVDEFQLCKGTALPVSGTGWKWVKFTTTTKGRVSVHIVIRGFQNSWVA